MRILIVGGLGVVGRALTECLRGQGHDVSVTSHRMQVRAAALHIDLAALPAQDVLVEHLRGFDMLINAAGVGPSARPQVHWLLHHEAACRLFDACLLAGVPRVIQVSALGDPATGSFIASKHAADAYLMRMPLRALVIRPSLIFSRESESTRLLLMLARLPLLALPDGGAARVQPVHIADIAAVIAEQVGQDAPASRIIEVAGPRQLSMAEYVQGLRRSLGGRRAWQLPLPAWLAKAGFTALGLTGSSLGGLQTLRVLRAGSVSALADSRPSLRDPADFLLLNEVLQEHAYITRSAAVWVGRVALATVCLASALLPLFAMEQVRPQTWLAKIGLHGAAADTVFALLIVVDLACAAAALLARSAGTWTALALVFVAYTVVMTLFFPGMWLDPFGALLKNIPIIAWVGALALLDSTMQRSRS